MNKAISKGNNGIKGQLAMSDWTWCYGGSEKNMKDYNKANTGYQEGKNKNKLGTGTKEGEYEGQFYYEFEELKIAHYLLNNMTTTELSGALYYNCYAYSGSLISEMQNYSKDIVLITDKIKDYTEFTTVPDSAGVKPGDKTAYAKEKLAVLRMQAKNDWTNTGVDKKAEAVKSQPWADMRTELQDAKDYEYTKVKSDDTKKGDWQVRCECLEDRVIARIYSCCGQRVSEAKSSICGHATNPDGSKVTKDYDTKQKISKFASDYENVLMYMAARTQVEFQTPEKGYQTQGSARSYVTGYYGDIAGLISEVSTGADVSRMTYSEQNTITMKIGASFDDEVDGDDRAWWLSVQVDSERNANEKKDTDFGPFTVEETSNGAKITYKYTYDFQGWFLDQECKFVFNPEDDVDFNLVIYAGYKVTKTKIS